MMMIVIIIWQKSKSATSLDLEEANPEKFDRSAATLIFSGQPAWVCLGDL